MSKDSYYSKLVKKHGSIKAAAREFGVPESTFRRRLKTATTSPPLEKQTDDLTDLGVGYIPPNPKPIEVIGKQKKNTATAIICASDWHAEENILPEVVCGLNSFNLKTCEKRVETFWKKSLYLLNFARNISDISEAVVWLGGDMINGYIHSEMEEANFIGPAEAISFVQDMVIRGLEFIESEGNLSKITVVCNRGNHGRSTAKKRIHTDYRSNWEYLMYCNLSFYHRGKGRIKYIIPKGYMQIVDIQGYRCRFHHGDAIKGGTGVSGISPAVNRAISQWNKSMPADYDFFGHFHQYCSNWKWLCNGSLCGYNSYAMEVVKAEYQPACQGFCVIDKKHGKVLDMPIFL